MFEVIGYFAIAYFLVFITILLVGLLYKQGAAFDSRRQVSRKVWMPFLVASLLMLPLVPYVVVEINTVLGSGFLSSRASEIHEQAGTDKIILEKVLLYTPLRIDVYVVAECQDLNDDKGAVGGLCTFERTQSGWKLVGGYEAVWSDCGSAHGNVFPPYKAKGDF